MALALMSPWAPRAHAEDLSDEVVSVRVAQNNASARSQAAIDRMSNETDQKLAELRKELETIRNLKKYNETTRKLIESQEAEKAQTLRDIDGVKDVERGILPLMERMVDALEEFVRLDLPLYPEERASRIAQLRDLMQRADVTVAEKYRKLTEAYQIENEIGTRLDTFTGDLADGRTVEFLHVGRVLLIYRTANGDEAAYWDKQQGTWVDLEGAYRSSIDQAFRIAKKQAPPDLVTLPVLVPSENAR